MAELDKLLLLWRHGLTSRGWLPRKFPEPIKIGSKKLAWHRSVIEAWKKTGVVIILLGLTLAAPAIADNFKADLAECEARADMRMDSAGNPNATNAAINGAASILGAVIGNRDPSYALSGAAQ